MLMIIIASIRFGNDRQGLLMPCSSNARRSAADHLFGSLNVFIKTDYLCPDSIATGTRLQRRLPDTRNIYYYTRGTRRGNFVAVQDPTRLCLCCARPKMMWEIPNMWPPDQHSKWLCWHDGSWGRETNVHAHPHGDLDIKGPVWNGNTVVDIYFITREPCAEYKKDSNYPFVL